MSNKQAQFLERLLPKDLLAVPRSRIVVIDGPNPPWSADPSSPCYNEADRLPQEWRPLVGVAFCSDRKTVGSIADVVEALTQEERDEWLALWKAESTARDGDLSASIRRLDWEEEHGVVWDSYGCNLRDPKTGKWIVEQW